MEFDILDSLDDLRNPFPSLKIKAKEQRCYLANEDNYACLRYSGILQDDNDIKEALEKGTKSLKFTQLVEWLSKELQSLNGMESCVNALTDPEDSSSFLLEISSFLKELHCPYKSLMNGPISQRLLDVQSRRTLLDFLCTELLTARMLCSKKNFKHTLEIEVDDSSTALSLYSAMKALNINDTEFSSNPVMCFTEIENKVKELLHKNSVLVPPKVITETLTEDQWESLQNLYEDFLSEYTVRREMLLTRVDVTIQSFKWGEGSKGKENKILDAYMPRRKKLKTIPAVKLSDIIAACEDLLIIEKTSSDILVKNTKSAVNRVVIPAVPDRGGRPKEHRVPVEMPNWSKRNNSQGGGRGGGNWQGKGKRFRGNQGGGGDRNQNNKGYYEDDRHDERRKFVGHKSKRRH